MKSLFLLLLLLPFSAWSQDIYSQGNSPWCLVQDELETCNYKTEQICYDSALYNGGYCRENSRRPGLRGEQRWCVVDARGRYCNYMSEEACIREAVKKEAGCVYNTERDLALAAKRKELAGFENLEIIEESGQRQLAEQLRDVQVESQRQQAEDAAPGGSE